MNKQMLKCTLPIQRNNSYSLKCSCCSKTLFQPTPKMPDWNLALIMTVIKTVSCAAPVLAPYNVGAGLFKVLSTYIQIFFYILASCPHTNTLVLCWLNTQRRSRRIETLVSLVNCEAEAVQDSTDIFQRSCVWDRWMSWYLSSNREWDCCQWRLCFGFEWAPLSSHRRGINRHEIYSRRF